MTARTQKHWTSEEQIIAAIDKAKAEQRQLCALGEQKQAEADAIVRLLNDDRLSANRRWQMQEMWDGCKSESVAAFKKADAKDKRLASLKEKLAAMRTEIMFPITTDRSVV